MIKELFDKWFQAVIIFTSILLGAVVSVSLNNTCKITSVLSIMDCSVSGILLKETIFLGIFMIGVGVFIYAFICVGLLLLFLESEFLIFLIIKLLKTLFVQANSKNFFHPSIMKYIKSQNKYRKFYSAKLLFFIIINYSFLIIPLVTPSNEWLNLPYFVWYAYMLSAIIYYLSFRYSKNKFWKY
ncbi:MAG: hypothetical protein PHU51_02605 [Candidatus Nanoarchaeia archaeon]|nr:hypothetical protein [Candidatus Nanoarchaeia archaeon]